MKALDVVTGILVIVGALNWGLIGTARFNLVAALFGQGGARLGCLHPGGNRRGVSGISDGDDARAGARACVIKVSWAWKTFRGPNGTRRIVMTKSQFHSIVLMFAALAAMAGFLALPRIVKADEPAKKDIVDTAVAAGNFKTLAAALKAAGLIDTLKGAGQFTVFAPTDEAFAKLPVGTVEDLLKPENKKKLVAILTYHVVPGKEMAKDVAGMSSAKTLNGKDLKFKVDGGKVMVNESAVTTADIEASNGVIHVIDAVLLP